MAQTQIRLGYFTETNQAHLTNLLVILWIDVSQEMQGQLVEVGQGQASYLPR